MTRTDSARAYLAKLPPAIAGQGGHAACFTVACAIVRLGIPPGEDLDLLREYNARCSPPWSERDLVHKMSDARRKASVVKPITKAPPPVRVQWALPKLPARKQASVASENGVQAAEPPQNDPTARNRILALVPERCAISRPELCRLSQPGLTPEQVAAILRELVLQGAIRTWREGCPEIGTLEVYSKGARR